MLKDTLRAALRQEGAAQRLVEAHAAGGPPTGGGPHNDLLKDTLRAALRQEGPYNDRLKDTQPAALRQEGAAQRLAGGQTTGGPPAGGGPHNSKHTLRDSGRPSDRRGAAQRLVEAHAAGGPPTGGGPHNDRLKDTLRAALRQEGGRTTTGRAAQRLGGPARARR